MGLPLLADTIVCFHLIANSVNSIKNNNREKTISFSTQMRAERALLDVYSGGVNNGID